MRMAYQRGMRGIRGTNIQQRFQLPHRAIQHQRFDLSRQVRLSVTRFHCSLIAFAESREPPLSYPVSVTPEQTFKLTRQLIDIESITGNEAGVGEFLFVELGKLGFAPTRMAAAENRFNIFAADPKAPTPQV